MDINELRATANLIHLAMNPYPGRGIVIGMDEFGKNMVQVYWIMGRSDNSRNRVFSSDDDGRLFTEAADPAKMQDPSLVIYNAMMECDGRYVVSNGSQTDDIANNKSWRYSFHDALSRWQYEPDAPNFTPRISCMCALAGNAPLAQLSVLRKSPLSETCDRAFYVYSEFPKGYGYCITTYTGDGNPLPSWRGDPLLVPLYGDTETIAEDYWGALNEDNRVSLAVKFIPMDGSKSTIHIINKYAKV